jgi:hypothetical protein
MLGLRMETMFRLRSYNGIRVVLLLAIWNFPRRFGAPSLFGHILKQHDMRLGFGY